MNETENRQDCLDGSDSLDSRNKTHRGNFQIVTLFCPVCKRKKVIAVSPFHQYAAYRFVTFLCCAKDFPLTDTAKTT